MGVFQTMLLLSLQLTGAFLLEECPSRLLPRKCVQFSMVCADRQKEKVIASKERENDLWFMV
jgi:hypothetical protein